MTSVLREAEYGGESSAARLDHSASDLLRSSVTTELSRFCDQKLKELPDEALLPWMQLLRSFIVEGGKRMRAVLCGLAFRGAGGDAQASCLNAVGAALELLQAFLLIQDDIIDGSLLRRGRPTLHRQLAAWNAQRSHRAEDAVYGQSIAILLSDIALGWALELVNKSVTDPLRAQAVRTGFDRLVRDVNYGQALEMLLMADRRYSVSSGLRVAHYKTATYTVLGPLLIGGALASAPAALQSAYAELGLPVGVAFQLRDDLLGVFGSAERTGKSNLDDLREGKPTVLISLSLERMPPAQRDHALSLYGQPDLDEKGAAELRSLIRATGAIDEIEVMIAERAQKAMHTLSQAPMTAVVQAELAAFIQSALYRDR